MKHALDSSYESWGYLFERQDDFVKHLYKCTEKEYHFMYVNMESQTDNLDEMYFSKVCGPPKRKRVMLRKKRKRRKAASES